MSQGVSRRRAHDNPARPPRSPRSSWPDLLPDTGRAHRRAPRRPVRGGRLTDPARGSVLAPGHPGAEPPDNGTLALATVRSVSWLAWALFAISGAADGPWPGCRSSPQYKGSPPAWSARPCWASCRARSCRALLLPFPRPPWPSRRPLIAPASWHEPQPPARSRSAPGPVALPGVGLRWIATRTARCRETICRTSPHAASAAARTSVRSWRSTAEGSSPPAAACRPAGPCRSTTASLPPAGRAAWPGRPAQPARRARCVARASRCRRRRR